MPFQFPDPSVSTRVENPATGEWWVYEDGVWILEEEVPEQGSQTLPDTGGTSPTPTPTPTPTDNTCDDLEAEIAALRTEINLLQNDIIGLRAELSSATTNSFLILE